MRIVGATSGTLALATLFLCSCGVEGTAPNHNDFGRAAAALHGSATVIAFGWGEGCIDEPALRLRFLDHGVGTYTSPSEGCPAPDGGVATLCDFGLEASMGATPGTGTLKITKVPDTIWGEYEGEVILVFDTADGEQTHAFSFVAPVCGIE